MLNKSLNFDSLGISIENMLICLFSGQKKVPRQLTILLKGYTVIITTRILPISLDDNYNQFMFWVSHFLNSFKEGKIKPYQIGLSYARVCHFFQVKKL